MSLTNVKARLTAAERAREPRSLALRAYYDGWTQATSGRQAAMTYPRPLTTVEARSWRKGWAEGFAARRCHEAHGFGRCPGEH